LEREISPSLQEYLTAIYKREGAVKWVRTTDVASDLRRPPAPRRPSRGWTRRATSSTCPTGGSG